MERPSHSHGGPRNESDLVVYPGVLLAFRVPRDCDVGLLNAAITKIKRDIELSIERHLPAGCVAELQKMA